MIMVKNSIKLLLMPARTRTYTKTSKSIRNVLLNPTHGLLGNLVLQVNPSLQATFGVPLKITKYEAGHNIGTQGRRKEEEKILCNSFRVKRNINIRHKNLGCSF